MFVMRSRRSAATVVLAVLVSTLLPVSLSATFSHSAAAADPTTVPTPMRIGSYNIRADRTLEQFRTAVGIFKEQIDVGGLQESTGTHKNNVLREDLDWRVYQAPSYGQIPIIWNATVFEFVSGREYKLAEGRRVEAKGGGGLKHQKTSFVPIVRLRHAVTGQLISVVNVHLISGAINRGRPDRSRPRAWGFYVDQVASLRRAMLAEKGAGFTPFSVGDYNIGFEADQEVRHRKHPFRRLKKIGLTSSWEGHRFDPRGTHVDTDCPRRVRYCGAYLDGVWSQSGPVSAQVFHEVELSDHYPIAATYDLDLVPGYVPSTGTAGFARTHLAMPERNKPWQVRNEPMRFELAGDLDRGYVRVEVIEGTARLGSDFTVDTSALYDSDPGTNYIDVLRLTDTQPEADKTFTLRLVDPVRTTITVGEATGTILDDD